MTRRARFGLGFAMSVLAAAVLTIGAGGCSTIGYYAQGAAGHVKMLASARPVVDVMEDPATPQPLRERLALSQRIRDFASDELGLPRNGSYRRYADLGRPAAVWNVVAAPELSLQLVTTCFPLVGCVGYRGYFDMAAAERAAGAERAKGYEAAVYPVPAYSSLGWFSDPLLNTFIDWAEIDLARLVFHELAHQVVYAKGDTTFNESFAVAVERLGGGRWMAAKSTDAAKDAAAAADARRRDFQALTAHFRAELETLYAGDLPIDEKRLRKAETYARLQAEYRALRDAGWGGYAGYDAWFARVDNAMLGVQAVYDDKVPAFERLFAREGSDFPRFYAAVRRLAALPKSERDAALDAL